MTMLERVDRTGMVKAIESVADRDPCEDEAIRIIAPTLVVVGAEDAATPPEKSRRLVDLIATTSYHEIPGEDPWTKSAVVQLAFPIRAWGDNIPMMLLAIAVRFWRYA